jgi:diaminohydroxyphosphoribosylaminopyrimidine deaminase/5-amino-6-(5-phosphoribosylamino)uracil reductase
MTETAIERAMRHALSLAARGPAYGVNPQVGCVILAAGDHSQIIAEGWHRGAGTPHAEVDALSKLRPEQTRGATAVVTLEPCNHFGRTGPCSEALIAAGIGRVVYAVSDPGVHSSGGAERLRQAGVIVESGVLADEVSEAMRAWLTATRLRRPFVTVKWAASLDGRAAAADGTSQWITGTAARQRVHEQREQSDAILVGTGTVLADDPSLTARGDAGELMPHQPIPVVIGERAIPADAKVFSHPQPAIVTGSRDLGSILSELFDLGIRHAFVEGGPALASAFVAADLVDQYFIYLAPIVLGGGGLALGDIGVATIGEAKRLTIEHVERLGDDLLVVARPREGN